MKPERPVQNILDELVNGDPVSRRHMLKRAGTAGVTLAGLPAFLSACGGVKGASTTSSTAAKAAVAAVDHPKVPIENWTFSNWPLYIDKKVLKTFNKEFGGKVKYVEEINDNFEFFGKVRQQLRAGRSIDRDIVTLTDYMAARWVRSNYVDPIDKKNVPNMSNLVDNLKTINYDPERNFTLPWQSGAIGLGYNIKKTGREITSVKDLFDPKFKGRVSMLAEPYDSANAVLLGDGVDASKATIDQIMGAIEKIDEANQAGQFRRFTGNDYTTDLTKGNVWIALAYSGDLIQLQSDNPDLRFAYPEEGAMLFTDNMMIPKDAANPYAAETMMNYVYDPEVQAKITEFVNYIPPVKGVKELVDPELADNELIFPSEAISKKLYPYPALSSGDERAMQEAMAKVTGA